MGDIDADRAEALRLAKAVKNQEQAEAAFDALTGYLLDHCPAGDYWEDFDPDVDEARDKLIDEYEL